MTYIGINYLKLKGRKMLQSANTLYTVTSKVKTKFKTEKSEGTSRPNMPV